ncbi:hypothetical protein V2J09_001839 [Rumex salicifolius]
MKTIFHGMKEMEGKEEGEGHVVAIALNGGSKSKYVIKWALEKFMSESNVTFKLFHIYPPITAVPTPMGTLIPITQVREDVANAYRKEAEWQKTEIILPYQRLCIYKKVPTEIVLIESDDIQHTLAMEISKARIKELVIGASSLNNSLFSRKVKGQLLSSMISESTPGFCTVYIISKGKLESLRPSEAETTTNIKDEHTRNSSDSSDSSSKYSSSTLEHGSSSSSSGSSFASPSLTKQWMDNSPSLKPSFNETMRETTDLSRWRSLDLRDEEDALSFVSGNYTMNAVTSKSFTTEAKSWMTQQPSPMNSPLPPCSPQSQTNNGSELERLRMELRHVRGMYTIAQSETVDATRKLNDLSKLRFEEAVKLKEINNKEDKAKEQAWMEKEKAEAAKKEVDYVRECTLKEAYQRREAELFAAREAKEKEKLKNALASPNHQYQKFSWEDIVLGSSSFAEENKLGMGSYGTVYKCKLHHTNVAVKVLHTREGAQSKQFQQELEILSRIRHPHLLLLLGACPEKGGLVYEFMENGSLEERLFRTNNTPPIAWYDRFRIAWEVASALAFLHNTKPKPIIHRDMKPANILLDSNLVSKIGDAGLCTMLNLDPSSMTMASRTLYKDTSPVGTLCYIDPEYQRTGQISTKSDVYALGMVILQLLTAKPAVGIAHIMEDVINEGGLMQILDKSAGKWPVREATELALLGLQCAELRRKDRPDLKDKVLPTLERLKETADEAKDVVVNGPVAPPSHFICPILKDVMDDPCVASDGYTYDRKAIEMWVQENDTSPTTNFPLANKNLIPNFTLQYAITEWKAKRKSPRNSLRSF